MTNMQGNPNSTLRSTPIGYIKPGHLVTAYVTGGDAEALHLVRTAIVNHVHGDNTAAWALHDEKHHIIGVVADYPASVKNLTDILANVAEKHHVGIAWSSGELTRVPVPAYA